MRASLALFASLALGLAAPALADVTARYTVGPPPAPPAPPAAHGTAAPPPIAPVAPVAMVTIAADDHGQARIDASGGSENAVFITREGVGYFSVPGPHGRLIGRQADLLAFITQMGGMMRDGPGAAGIQRMAARRVEIAERGTETVAGVRGTVYALTMVDGATRAPPVEIVLSTDAALAPVGREILRMVDAGRGPITAIMGTEPQMVTGIRDLLGRGTPIRIGTMFRLASVSTDPVPGAAFALPGPVLTREELMAQIMPPMPAPAAAAPSAQPAPPANHPAGDAPHPR